MHPKALIDDLLRQSKQQQLLVVHHQPRRHPQLPHLPRERLTVARDLLTDSGSIFVQIGDENVHRVRAVMDEVFGDENFVCQIAFAKTTSTSALLL